MNTNDKESYYVVIPTNILINTSISSQAKILYGYISSLINSDGYCFASNDYLAEKLNVTTRQVRNYLQELEDNQVIKRELIYSDSKEVKARKIYLGVGKNISLGGEKYFPRGGEENFPYITNTYNNKYSKRSLINKEYINKELNKKISFFENWWEEYPKHINKKGCQAVFEKIPNLEKIFPKMMETLKRQKVSDNWLKNDGQFIPYPLTYLHQERWEDEASYQDQKETIEEDEETEKENIGDLMKDLGL